MTPICLPRSGLLRALTLPLAIVLMIGSAMAPGARAEALRGGEPHGGVGHGVGGHSGGTWRGSVGAWQSGHWYRGWHGNRFGWWWAVPGYDDWYAYDEPAYPLPAYPVTGYPGAPAAPYYWYYCANPPGYYPYVPQCSAAWQAVPPPA